MAQVENVTVRINTVTNLKETEKDFDSLNSSVNKGTKDMNTNMGKLNKSILQVGAALGGALAIKAVVGDAVKRIREFQQSMADLGASTGKSGADLDKFKKSVLEVSKNTGKGASEIAKAFQIVGSATPELLKSADALGKVTEQAVILAKAGGLEVPEAAAALTKAMNQFGAGADEAAKFTDILATSQQAGTATIAQLSDSLKNVGAVANAIGLSFEDTNVALQALAKGGLEGAEAGTGLRTVLSKLSTQSNDSINPSLTSLTDVVNNLADKNLDLKGATKLVGEENAKTLLTLVAQKDVVGELTGKLNDQGNALKQAEDRFKTVDGQVEALDATYGRFILSFEDGSGVISQASSEIIGSFDGILQSLTDLNDFDFDKIFDAESLRGFGDGALELGKILTSITNPAAAKLAEELELKANASLDAMNDKFSTLTQAQLKNEQVVRTMIKAYVAQGFSVNEAKDKVLAYRQAEEETTPVLDEQTEAVTSNLDALKKLSAERIKAHKRRIADSNEAAKGDEEEEDAFFAWVDREEKKVDTKTENREKDRESRKEQDDLDFEQTLSNDDKILEHKQQVADAEMAINEQIGFSALALASALATAIGGGQSAQLAALAFDKIAAIAQIVIKIQASNAAIIAEGNALAIPTGGASAVAAAGLVTKNNIAAGISIGTILATAIPQVQSITAPKKLKDGEVMIQGPGTETSDSIPALLSKNESIINAEATRKNQTALRAINSGKFEEYMEKEILKRVYLGGGKTKKELQASKNPEMKFPNGFKVTNPRDISAPLLDAMEEHSFLNQNGSWD